MQNKRPAVHAAGSYAIVQMAVRPGPDLPDLANPPPLPLAPERSRWRKLAAVLPGVALLIAAAIGGAQWSSAQRRDAPRIDVAPTILAEPASQAALIIRVGPPDSLPNNSFLRLRGFPASVSLTEGHAIAPGSWAIPLFGLSSLKAIVPAGVSGRNEISISLVGVDGTTLAESRTALVIAAPTPPQERIIPEPPPRQVAPTPPPERVLLEPPPRQLVPVAPVAPPLARRPPPPDVSGEDAARAERMLSQGAKHLEQGNISAARMFFQRAAEAGSAVGAIRMGATYDPTELSRFTALAGITGDRNEARKWYERARDLGAPDAEDRLGRLGGR
jgi:hypothetical protein